MQFKKNIWLIYNVFLVMGLVYFVATTYSRWEELRQGAAVELAYLNRIFASSITLNFDQQEIMLDLLGRTSTTGQAASRLEDHQAGDGHKTVHCSLSD